MLKSPLLFAISILVTLLSWTSIAKSARAVETVAGAGMELSFALPPAKQTASEKAVKPDVAVSSQKEQSSEEQPQKEQLQSSGSDSLLSDELARPKEPLPPISENPVSKNVEGSTSMVTSKDTASGEKASEQNIGVQFLKDDVQMPSQQQAERDAELPAGIPPEAVNVESSAQSGAKANSADLAANLNYGSSSLDDWIFEGGSGSLVAHAVGSAEGTRQWDGERTRAYYGHTDPGNGVWNLGTFSYQHEANSPEDADDRQIKRLKVQGFELEEQATQQGMKLSLPEKLNGLDLANQAPLAALGKGGYIERLAQAHRLQLQGDEAISWARTQAYRDPDTQSWNAPGLGNNIYSISKDQERRMSAIDKALRAYRPTDESSLALASLKDISLEKPTEKSKLNEPSLDSLTEAFKLGDRPTHPSTLANSASENTAADINSLEASSEVTFTLPASTQTGSHSAVAIAKPATQTAPADEEVLASIVPSADEPSTPSIITPSTSPTVEPEALAFDATSSEATLAPKPEVERSEVDSMKPVEKQANHQESTDDPAPVSEPAPSELFDSAKLPDAIEKPLIRSASDEAVQLEARLDTNDAAKASIDIAANDTRGDRPAPSRSWWRTEDRVVQKK